MPLITLEDAKPWSTGRLELDSLDDVLANQVGSQVIARVSPVFETSGWLTPNTTPTLIKSIICMIYVGREYQKHHVTEVSELDYYGTKLIEDANLLIDSLLAGLLFLLDEDGNPILPYKGGMLQFEPVESDPAFSMGLNF